MSIQEFSGGYYSVEMDIQSYEDGPVIDRKLYDEINCGIYQNTDTPITMKTSMDNGIYFSVSPENGVPPFVLALPEKWVDNLDVLDDGRTERIYLVKPSYAYMLQQNVNGDWYER